jgi:hypothetical protein
MRPRKKFEGPNSMGMEGAYQISDPDEQNSHPSRTGQRAS